MKIERNNLESKFFVVLSIGDVFMREDLPTYLAMKLPSGNPFDAVILDDGALIRVEGTTSVFKVRAKIVIDNEVH